MSPSKRYAKKHAKARQRRRLQAHERLERDRRQAQRAAEALHQALEDLGLPANLVAEIEGRLRSQHKLLGKMIGVMFPALFGCRTPSELCRVRGWDKQWPARMLGALPKRSWLKRLRRLALEVLEPLWRHVRTRARPPRVAGSGPGSGMTRYFTSMVSNWVWSAGGGAASKSVCCRALTGSCFWWSLAMVAWSSQWTLPFDGLIRWAWGAVPGQTELGPGDARRAFGSVCIGGAWLRLWASLRW